MVDGGGETPGPIPNPEAKPARADGTAPGREWESRLPPTQQLHTQHPPQDTTSCGGCLLFVLHATPFTAAWAALWGLSSKKCVCYRRVGGLDVTLLSRFPRDRTCSRYANGPTTGMNTRKSTIQTSDHRLLGCLKNTMILATNSTTAANVSSIKT